LLSITYKVKCNEDKLKLVSIVFGCISFCILQSFHSPESLEGFSVGSRIHIALHRMYVPTALCKSIQELPYLSNAV